MRITRPILCIIVLSILCISVCGCRRSGGSASDAGSTPQSEVPQLAGDMPGMPGAGKPASRLPDLQRYAPSTGKPEAERLAGLLGVLRTELKAPREPEMGLGGGPIDQGYVVGVVVGIMELYFSSETIRSGMNQERDPEIRRLLSIPLVMEGDQDQMGAVRDLALHHSEGGVRASAMRALGKTENPTNQQTFMAAMKDPYCRLLSSEATRGNWAKTYPVRSAAADGLYKLGQARPAAAADVPLTVTNPAALFAKLLDDKDPSSCLSAVKLLICTGREGRSYLEQFVERNRTESHLQESLNLARKALR